MCFNKKDVCFSEKELCGDYPPWFIVLDIVFVVEHRGQRVMLNAS